MSYSILAIPPFDKQSKRLAKKYPSLKAALSDLIDDLQTNPKQGAALGRSCYKIRLAISSKGKGKSGGVRIITNFVVAEDTIFLLSIYDKADKETLTEQEPEELLQLVPE